ncbi:MAG: hypothetical protein QY326_08460 [Bdellovibrionota bacterium]|nr:MAG: hypothetical protein QY326_08460 [Bdellovibrionota bacterium]
MVSRRAFLNTTMKTLAAASAAGVMRPMFTMAQSPAGGILKNVVHVFLYGGLDGRWAYPYHEGPVQQVLAARRPNINQLPWAGNPITLDQHGRANPIGFQSSWQELLNAVQITNCGISLLTEYGITEGYSFSHEIAQNMFHNGNNIENYSTVPKGWLARLIDGYQLPQFTTWGFRVTEPTFFNSEFSTPLVISNVDDFKHERRHFGNLYCSTDTGHPEYMIGCPIGQSWQGRESTAEEDNILMRQVMKDIRSAPSA